MARSEFLLRMRAAVSKAAAETFAGTRWTAEGCPWIEHWYDYYENKDAAHIERAVRKFAPDAAHATSADAYVEAATARMRAGIERWLASGELPDVPAGVQIPLNVTALSAWRRFSSMLFKSHDDAPVPVDTEGLQAALDTGTPLDGRTKTRMEGAFGYDFSDVRVHNDGSADQLSKSFGARAFTIGPDIAFAANEYRPGDLAGDALIAHELAHVVQQRGAAPATSSSNTGGLEQDADRAAMRAVVALWSGEQPERPLALPSKRTGLQLQRCSPSPQPVVATPKGTPVDEPGPVRPMVGSQLPIITHEYPRVVQSCGNVSWPVHYELPAPAASRGWLIQHVVIRRRATTAAGADQNPIDSDYYEAFGPIAANGTNPGRGPNDYYGAMGQLQNASNTRGTTTWTGKIKFYEGTLPRNFLRDNPETNALSLPSTRTRPDWWDDTGVDHNLTLNWNCIGKNDRFEMFMQIGEKTERDGNFPDSPAETVDGPNTFPGLRH